MLHVFFLLAFVTTGISPACAFVSGQSQVIEICTADGLLQIIDLAESQNEQQKRPAHSQKTQDCGFCFAQSHLTKSDFAASFALIVDLPRSSLPVSYYSDRGRYRASLFQPRGPPIFS